MKLYLAIPVFFAALLLQSSQLLAFSPMRLRPDLLLLFVIGVGVIGGSVRAVVWAVVAGLLLDLMSAAPLGTHLLALLPIALLTVLRETDLVEGKLTLAMALVFAGTFVYDSAQLAILQATGERVEWARSLFWIMLPSAVLNTAVMPLVFWVVRRMALPPLTRLSPYAA